MIFKTIYITKKHIIAAVTTAAVLLSAAAVTTRIKGRATAVFSQQNLYEDILNEGLPSEKSDISFKELLDRLLGFDLKNPETIIKEYSNIFDSSSAPPEDNIPEEAVAPTEEPNTEGQEIQETPPPPVFPSAEQINGFSGIEISNATSYSVNTDELIRGNLCFNISKDMSPEILIIHTHTTESYGDYGERNTDSAKNVVAVGETMKAVFEQYGIGVIHDTTVHDYPSYQGAYTRTLNTVQNNLSSYPSLKIVLDIHRDGYVYADGSKLTRTVQINNENTAQVMIVAGTDSMGLYHPSWRENLRLASKIQSAASLMYPNLMRPIDLRKERFNMHTTTGSLLLEVGANGNTIEEAKRGGYYAAMAIAAVLTQ